MNDDIVTLLFDAVQRVEKSLAARDAPALVAVQGQRTLFLSDYDYLQSVATAQAFERRAAEQALRVTAVRWIFAVPQVWKIGDRDVAVRAAHGGPLEPGEEEAITWMAYDEEDGVDYGRVPFARRLNGEPVFDEPQVFTVPLTPGDLMPGTTMLRYFLSDRPGLL